MFQVSKIDVLSKVTWLWAVWFGDYFMAGERASVLLQNVQIGSGPQSTGVQAV